MGKINLIKVISTISALGIIGGGAVFLTLLTSCSNAQSVFINKDTATENYENLYVFNSNTKIPLLHTNVINLQTLSKKNHDSKKFIINSEIIDTPIYIPYGFTNFDLSCSATGRLVSSNSERVASKINIGIVFGSKVENYNNTYSLNANIHNMFIQISNDPGVGTFGIFGIFPQDEQNSHLYLQNNLILASESSDDKAIDIENIYFLTIRNNLFSSNGDGTSTIEISGNKTVEIFDNYINSASSTGLAIFMRTLRNNATFNLKNNFISSVQTPWVLGSAIQLMNLNKCDYILENNSFSVFNSMHQYVSTFTDFIIQTNSPEKD
jgi:hypothetical protein